MVKKPTHLGFTPSDDLNKISGTPRVGGFFASPELDTPPLFQESVEAKMRLLANLIIDKMLKDERNGTLKSRTNSSNSDLESQLSKTGTPR
ncbi:MAG TPA: hypothetical protein DCX59_02245 [Candidatus Pacebacteria bacterium]|nr:hypothetical protein [Candidatus Paceibacterota bacterium]